MMLSFILPVLIAAYQGIREVTAPARKGQMAYILERPLAYAWVLMCNLFRTLPSYVLERKFHRTTGTHGNDVIPWALYTPVPGGRHPHSRAAILWKTSVKKTEAVDVASLRRNGSAGLDFDVHCIPQTG